MKKTIKEQKLVLIILLSNLFIAYLGIGLIVPVMPSFMNIMHLSGKTMGYLVAVLAVAQLLISPLAGRWVDHYGRKKIIIIGLFLFGVSELIFGLGIDDMHAKKAIPAAKKKGIQHGIMDTKKIILKRVR